MPNIDKHAIMDVTVRRTHWARQILKTYDYVVVLSLTGDGVSVTAHPRKPWLCVRRKDYTESQCRTMTYRTFVEEVWAMITKPTRPESPNGQQAPLPDEKTRKKYPTVLAYLEDTAYADGSARQPATLTLFVRERSWRASLNDRQENRTLWVDGDTLEGLLASLERLLASPDCPWRWEAPAKPWGARKRPQKGS